MSATARLIDALSMAHETIGTLRAHLDAALDRVDELTPKPTPAFTPDGIRIWPDLTPEQVKAEVIGLMHAMSEHSPRKIDAIKRVRTLTRLGLKESKDLVETVMPRVTYTRGGPQ